MKYYPQCFLYPYITITSFKFFGNTGKNTDLQSLTTVIQRCTITVHPCNYILILLFLSCLTLSLFFHDIFIQVFVLVNFRILFLLWLMIFRVNLLLCMFVHGLLKGNPNIIQVYIAYSHNYLYPKKPKKNMRESQSRPWVKDIVVSKIQLLLPGTYFSFDICQ